LVEKIVSLTHGKDLDGIASAAIVLRYARKKSLPYEVYFSEPSLLIETFQKITAFESEIAELIISDIGLNKGLLTKVINVLNTVKGKYSVKIRWFDHHLWDSRIKEKISEIVDELVVNERFCAAELIQRHILPEDAIAAKLAFLARDADFWIFSNEISKKLSKIISYREVALKDLIVILSKGEYWNEVLEKAYSRALEREKELLDKGLKSLETYKVKKFNVALVKGKIPAGEIAEILAKKGYDIIVVVSPEGKVSLRRGSKKVNLVPIAEKLNGGGHPFAAGGSLNYHRLDKLLAKYFGIFRKKEIILKVIEEVLT